MDGSLYPSPGTLYGESCRMLENTLPWVQGLVAPCTDYNYFEDYLFEEINFPQSLPSKDRDVI